LIATEKRHRRLTISRPLPQASPNLPAKPEVERTKLFLVDGTTEPNLLVVHHTEIIVNLKIKMRIFEHASAASWPLFHVPLSFRSCPEAQVWRTQAALQYGEISAKKSEDWDGENRFGYGPALLGLR
jgi:hypothetical protein